MLKYAMMRASQAFNKISGFAGASSLSGMGKSAYRMGRMDMTSAFGKRAGMGPSRNFGREMSRFRGNARNFLTGGGTKYAGTRTGMGIGAARAGGVGLGVGAAADFMNPWGLGWGD